MRIRRTKKRPQLHLGRPSRDERAFAAQFEGECEQVEAVSVRKALEGFTGLDLSGLEPDDLVGDLVPPFDSLDEVETMMGLEGDDAAQKRPLMKEVIAELFWARVLREVLGSRASACSWSPETLPHRSIRSVVQQAVLLSPHSRR